ncbi:receptor-like protein EIX1 [Oryza glaberrima]|nr:receptor-like protein EIX1 [Oryza glaberrima]
MDPTQKFLLFLLVGVAATLSLATNSPVPQWPASCTPREREALLAFKRGITGDPTGRLTSWKRGSHDCCQWRGVRCSNLTGHVLELHLRNNFPRYDEATALVGHISTSLISLEHLEHLDLSNNNLVGPAGQFPRFVSSLRNLIYINFSGMPLTGMVPPQLGNITKLQYLDLSHGIGMYSTDIQWLTNLPALRYLGLSNVNLSRVSDWPHVVNMNSYLIVLDLSGCSLTSASQSFSQLNLTRLEKLDLSYNNFNQPLAFCWFWNLTSLTYLDLTMNTLSGQFPDSLGDMKALQVFKFWSNGHSIIMPNLLRNLCNLEILDLGGLRSCNITELLDSLMHCLTKRIRKLYLWNNNITGTLPTGVGKFTSLDTLDLSDNQLTGSVPYEISMLTSLAKINLSLNNLTGEITKEHLAGLKSLKSIDLYYNPYLKIVLGDEWLPPFRLEVARFGSCQLGPMFPSWLQWMVDIKVLDICNTGINDQLPHWFWTIFSRATELVMSSNKISGSLPTNMETMSLEHLLLGSNQITGVIPILPPNLIWLEIQNNMLSGSVASKTFGAPQLGFMDLSSNNITGPISGSICELLNLDYLNLANNHLEGEFPRCIGFKNLELFHLNNNSLSGKVPSFLKGCKRLKYLDLSQNKFHGRLPSWIGDLPNVERIILNNNLLSGHIPTSITNLTNLQHLDLSQNKFHGRLSSWIGDLPAIQILLVNNNSFSGYIPTNITNLVKLTQLNLANNNISGILP